MCVIAVHLGQSSKHARVWIEKSSSQIKYKAGLFAAAKLFLPDSKLRFLQESSTKDLRYKNKPAPRPVMCTLLQKLNGQAEFWEQRL